MRVEPSQLAVCIGFCLQRQWRLPSGDAHAQSTDDSLRLYAVDIWQDPPQSWGPGRGVYLGNGLVITVAHVVAPVARTRPNVRIAGMDLLRKPSRKATSNAWT